MILTPSRAAITGLLFLVIFLFGYWLRRTGKPYNSLLLNAHKLISLGAVVYLARIVYQFNQAIALNAFELTVIGITFIFFLVGIISGGLVSIDKPLPAAVQSVHHVTPYLTVISTALTLYLLSRPA
jgi:hypothetical protein